MSATIGALALCGSGHRRRARASSRPGASGGSATPWARSSSRPRCSAGARARADVEHRSAWEAFALAVTLVGASLVMLTEPHATRPYLVFPPLIWAALRFGPRGATAATLAVSIVTVASTICGRGAFAVSSMGDNLMALEAFLASVALTSLVLGATAAERAARHPRARALHLGRLARAAHAARAAAAAGAAPPARPRAGPDARCRTETIIEALQRRRPAGRSA